ncbi:MAG: HprK-related kinase B [Desulfobacteraceae bacterium]
MTPPPLSRRQLIDALRRSYPAENTLHLKFGRCSVQVATNAPAINQALKDYFGQFCADPQAADIVITAHEAPEADLPVSYRLKPPEPGKSKIKEEYVDLADGRIVRKCLTGMVFIFGGDGNLAIGPCQANLNQVVNFINNRYIEWLLCQGGLLGHAAGVVIEGRGLALAGFSGAGKSTLALHLMRKGAVFVSNDRLIIQQNPDGLMMHGVAKLPRINPGTALNNPHLQGVMSEAERRRFSGLPPEELWNLEHKYDAPIDACFGPDRFELSAPMSGLVILNWRRGQQPMTTQRVALAERRDLLPAFMKPAGLFFLPDDACRMPEPTPAGYLDLLSSCPVWEFSGGIDFEAATRACLDLWQQRL